LPGDVVDDLQADFRRQVNADAVELGHGHVEHGAVGLVALDAVGVGGDGVDVISLPGVGADGLVAVLVAVGAGADDRDGWLHGAPNKKPPSPPRTEASAAGKGVLGKSIGTAGQTRPVVSTGLAAAVGSTGALPWIASYTSWRWTGTSLGATMP